MYSFCYLVLPFSSFKLIALFVSGIVKKVMQNCPFCYHAFKRKYPTQRFCSENCANKYNRNGLKQITLPAKSEDLAEFIGILLGDGDLTQYQVTVTLNTDADKDYIPYVFSLIRKVFPQLTPTINDRKTECCTKIRFSSRIAVDFFKDMGVRSGKPLVPKWIYGKQTYLLACLRGLIDTEGSIGFKIYQSNTTQNVYRQLIFTNRNPVLLTFATDVLNLLGFHCTQSKIKNIYISNDFDIDRYRSIIGFHNPKLEQRSLLRDYASYINWRGAGAAEQDGLENH